MKHNGDEHGMESDRIRIAIRCDRIVECAAIIGAVLEELERFNEEHPGLFIAAGSSLSITNPKNQKLGFSNRHLAIPDS